MTTNEQQPVAGEEHVPAEDVEVLPTEVMNLIQFVRKYGGLSGRDFTGVHFEYHPGRPLNDMFPPDDGGGQMIPPARTTDRGDYLAHKPEVLDPALAAINDKALGVVDVESTEINPQAEEGQD